MIEMSKITAHLADWDAFVLLKKFNVADQSTTIFTRITEKFLKRSPT